MNTETKVNKILTKIKQNSQRGIESEELLRQYLTEALTEGGPITFYNWECPPRFIDKTKEGRIFVNYDVDLGKIGRGLKLDQFTEIPRVVERAEDEKRILQFLRSLEFKFRFVKLIADTNAWYLTPASLEILGEGTVVKRFNEFKNLVEKKTKDYPVKTKVYLFRKLVEAQKLKDDYERAFAGAYQELRKNPSALIAEGTIKKQIMRTREHVGLTEPNVIKDFSLRTIATYGAEGIVFDKLAQTDEFSNCVWLNIEEVDERTIEISNFLRRPRCDGTELPRLVPQKQRATSAAALPMIFPVC